MATITTSRFLAAAHSVLYDAQGPLHYREIVRRAVQNGELHSRGETPEATLSSLIGTSDRQRMANGMQPVFHRVEPGVYGLRVWYI
jgi:hypothetical protein